MRWAAKMIVGAALAHALTGQQVAHASPPALPTRAQAKAYFRHHYGLPVLEDPAKFCTIPATAAQCRALVLRQQAMWSALTKADRAKIKAHFAAAAAKQAAIAESLQERALYFKWIGHKVVAVVPTSACPHFGDLSALDADAEKGDQAQFTADFIRGSCATLPAGSTLSVIAPADTADYAVRVSTPAGPRWVPAKEVKPED
jgi:hypothetical protein